MNTQPVLRQFSGEILVIQHSWSTGHLIPTNIQEDTTANALLTTTNGVLFLQKGLCSHIRLASFPYTYFLICLVMSFAAQLASDFVSTPYVLRQRHGTKVTPPPIICVMLVVSKMSSMSYSTTSIPMFDVLDHFVVHVLTHEFYV
jgi:hypothetical protein